MTTETKISFTDYSLSIAVKETATSEKSVFTAIVAISALLAGQQAALVLENKPLDEDKLANGFRGFLKRYAFMGNTVWSKTDDIAEKIKHARNIDTRAGMASDYIDKKDKGSRLVDGLARMRTYTFKLVKDTLKNHAGVIREMVDLKAAGAENDAIAERWTRHVKETYGATYAALSSALRDDKPRDETNTIDVIMRKAEKMTITELDELHDKLSALRDSRRADETEFSIALDGDGTPRVIPRLAA